MTRNITLWYHISKFDLGEQVVFKPKVPESALESMEGNIPRVCVSDSIYNCLRAITSNTKHLKVGEVILELRREVQPFTLAKDAKNIFVSPAIYVTELVPYIPPKCIDFRINREHWFITDTLFNRAGYISLHGLLNGVIEITNTPDKVETIGFEHLIKSELIENPNKKNKKIISKK